MTKEQYLSEIKRLYNDQIKYYNDARMCMYHVSEKFLRSSKQNKNFLIGCLAYELLSEKNGMMTVGLKIIFERNEYGEYVLSTRLSEVQFMLSHINAGCFGDPNDEYIISSIRHHYWNLPMDKLERRKRLISKYSRNRWHKSLYEAESVSYRHTEGVYDVLRDIKIRIDKYVESVAISKNVCKYHENSLHRLFPSMKRHQIELLREVKEVK